jgi:hypothetical protein
VPGASPDGLPGGSWRAATRGGGEVIELEYGITVYPAREEHGRLPAVWHEDSARQQCEAATEEKLAARLEKVTERLQVGAPGMKLSGADLIAHYLDPDRLPVDERWSRKHTYTQRRLCERFAVPVIGSVTCQDITTGHMQQIVNAAPTLGEGNRVRRALDGWPRPRAVFYLRDLLVSCGVLPAVDKQLREFQMWLDRRLEALAAHPHQQLLRQGRSSPSSAASTCCAASPPMRPSRSGPTPPPA